MTGLVYPPPALIRFSLTNRNSDDSRLHSPIMPSFACQRFERSAGDNLI
jgi:hypothetical protein